MWLGKMKKYLKLLIKKIVFSFPPIKRLYNNIHDMRNKIMYMQNQIEELQNYRNQDLYNLHYKHFYFESMFDEIYDTNILEKRFCPVCHNEVKIFSPAGETLRKNAICPYCISFERHRFLWLYLENHTNLFDNNNQKKLKILHFAPEKCFLDKFLSLPNIDYYPVDFNPSTLGIRDIIGRISSFREEARKEIEKTLVIQYS